MKILIKQLFDRTRNERHLCSFLGIKVWTMGIGPEGQKVAGEIKSVASSPEFAITGGLNALVQKAVFGQMTQSMITGQ